MEAEQGWIQDFPDGGANPKGWGGLLFGQISPKTACKWKKLDWEGARIPNAQLDPPMKIPLYYNILFTELLKFCEFLKRIKK